MRPLALCVAFLVMSRSTCSIEPPNPPSQADLPLDGLAFLTVTL